MSVRDNGIGRALSGTSSAGGDKLPKASFFSAGLKICLNQHSSFAIS